MTLVLLLGILVGTFALLTVADRLIGGGRMSARRRGQISLALLFLFTGLGHFVQTDQMAEMLPPSVPSRRDIILASGVMECLLAMGLIGPRYSRLAGICVMAFLVLVFPGNIYAAVNRVNFGGHDAGPAYLLVRGPFQLLLIAWAYWFAVRRSRANGAAPGHLGTPALRHPYEK